MKVSVLQEQLARGLSIVQKAVDSRPTLPVLGNVLVATDDARLKLIATNLEISITTYIGAKIEREGSVTLPTKALSELISLLSPERVDLTLDVATSSVNVRCGTTNADVRGIAAGEFPPVPEPSDPDIVIAGSVLKEMIMHTVFAAAKEDSRPILTGLYIQFDGDVMTMAAADGYRLAVRTARIDQHFAKRQEMVVPARTLNEVARVIVDEDREVGITLPGERPLVMFHIENTVIASQLIEGKFPDFTAIIPKKYSTAVTAYTSDLLQNCKRAQIFARDNHDSTRFSATPPAGPGEPGELRITGKSSERGNAEGFLDCSVEGEKLEVSFNIRYFIDVLNVIGEEQVVLESNGAAAAGVLRPVDRSDFLHVIMPMSR
jgi:DNA polymerase-3 subunit beta